MKRFIPPQTEEVKLLEQKQDEQENINQLETKTITSYNNQLTSPSKNSNPLPTLFCPLPN